MPDDQTSGQQKGTEVKMVLLPSLRQIKTVVLLLLAIPVSGLAATEQHHFYRSSGIAKINHDENFHDEAWVTQIGFNYALNANIKLDIGYSETPSYQEFSLFSPPRLFNQPELTYQGIFGGARVQHILFNNTAVYAKGGVTITRYDESLASSLLNTSREVAPYFSIGASIPAVDLMNLNLNVEISYQNPELKADATPIFQLGAQYRF